MCDKNLPSVPIFLDRIHQNSTQISEGDFTLEDLRVLILESRGQDSQEKCW